MTSTDQPTAPAPAPAPAAAPRSTHGRGNLRSLVISMAVMTVVVFMIVALMPHPAQRERATVDVSQTAAQVAADQHWPLATVRTGADWHPTLVGFAADEQGVPTWQIGYHHLPGDDRYITLAQTRLGGGVGTDQVGPWIDRESGGGHADGTEQIDGVTWLRRTVGIAGSDSRTRRSLVAQGAAAPGGLITVLSGEVAYADLEQFARSLQLTPVASGRASGTASGAQSPVSSGS